MKKLIALSFSDYHLDLWNQHNEGNRRTLLQLDFLYNLCYKASQLGVPILFSGDFMHNPKNVSNELLNLLSETLSRLPKCKIYCIPGNHDQSEVNYRDKKSPDYIDWLCKQNSNFINVSYQTAELSKQKIAITGLPYIKNNRNYSEIVKELRLKRSKEYPNILLIHTNLAGAKEPNGLEIDDVQNITRELHKYFKGWDLVLSGHIHKHQKLSSNVYMVGAPSQQRTSDSGCKMGYLEIYEDLSIKFIDSNQPEFIYIPHLETCQVDNYHIYLPLPEAKEESEEVVKRFSKNLKPYILGKRYLKVKGIKDKRKKGFLTKLLMQV